MADAELSVGLEGAEGVKNALNDIALTGANAFQKLTESLESGNFAGIAELIGGPLAGALVAAGQAVFNFVEGQAKLIVSMDALAKTSGTTIGAIQNLRAGFMAAGVGGERAMMMISRSMNRLSEQSTSVAQKWRDEGAQGEAAMERVDSANLRVMQTKERLSELSTEQAQKAVSEADEQASAFLNVQKTQQKIIDDLTGTPDKDMQKLFQQQEDLQAAAKARHDLEAANIKSANEQANEPIQTAQAQLSVREAETGKISATNRARDQELASLHAITQAINEGDQAFLKLVSPRAQEQAVVAQTQQRTGQQTVSTTEFLKTLEEVAHNLSAENIGEILKSAQVFARGAGGAQGRLIEAVQQGTLTDQNMPELTGKQVEAAKNLVEGTDAFKNQAENFGERAAATFIQVLQSAWGGLGGGGGPPGKAGGGAIYGPGSGTSDTAGLFALSHGEFVVRAAAVQKYGVDLFHALNGMEFPGMAMGGLVRPIPMATGGAVPASSIINLTIDGERFNGLRASDDVASKLKMHAISRQTASTGKQPSWMR